MLAAKVVAIARQKVAEIFIAVEIDLGVVDRRMVELNSDSQTWMVKSILYMSQLRQYTVISYLSSLLFRSNSR